MSYPGSKGQAGVWQRIIGQMPPHSLYVEAFAGSAQVFFRKRPAAHNVLIDVADRTTRNLTLAAANAEIGVGGPVVRVVKMDAVSWLLNNLALVPNDTVIYCDPPYMLATRTKQRLYGDHEMTDEDHATLIMALRSAKCFVLLSGYPSALYSSQLRDWRCCSYRTRTRGRTVTECLWMNYPEPTDLHDWRYAGQSHRQRVSFKRMATRWLTRLDGMSYRQRGYLLDTISQRHGERVRISLNGAERVNEAKISFPVNG